MDVGDVIGLQGRFTVRRIVLPSSRTESFTVIGPDRRPVAEIDEYLGWLTSCERSPNTIEAYAFDLKVFWSFLVERGLHWSRVSVMEIGEFAAWARQRPSERPCSARVMIARPAPNQLLAAGVGVGHRLPALRTSLGRVLLAGLDDTAPNLPPPLAKLLCRLRIRCEIPGRRSSASSLPSFCRARWHPEVAAPRRDPGSQGVPVALESAGLLKRSRSF